MMDQMRTVATLAGISLVLSLSSCGNEGVPERDGAAASTTDGNAAGAATASPDSGPKIVDLSEQVVLAASPYQRSAQDPVVLCFGPQTDIYPPNCGGPELEGAFSWADYDTQREGDVTWTDDGVFAVGHYDLDAGEYGTFTLTQPLRSDPTAGYTRHDTTQTDLDALCQDPTADAGATEHDGGRSGMDEEQALLMLLRQDLPGYSTSWLSEGGVTNVLFTEGTDIDSTRAAIREVYTGPLCLEVRDVPSDADLRAAQGAVSQQSDLRFHSVGTAGSEPQLQVEVVVPDRETVDAIYEAAAPWLAPEQIVITGAVQQLEP
ncbi:hypothetical protein [Serinicoccus sp. LYQ131]|uniref:hypothetical protein n=1 Tax=Serinicoccus sp. LYQ131 TaxID=3378797 RepID=UPI0038527828